MTGLNTRSKRVSLEPYSCRAFSDLSYIKVINLFPEPCSPASSSKDASASRSTWLQRLSLAGLLRVTLFAIGLAYATTSMLGEYHYWKAHHVSDINSVIEEFQKARAVFPLSYQFRKGPAMSFTSIALMEGADPRWKEVALVELESALNDDPTAAALLAPAITFELDMNQDALAKEHYRIDRRAHV